MEKVEKQMQMKKQKQKKNNKKQQITKLAKGIT